LYISHKIYTFAQNYANFVQKRFSSVYMQTFVISAPVQQIATSVEQLTPEQQDAARKFLHGGQVYLHYDGHLYDAKGVLVK